MRASCTLLQSMPHSIGLHQHNSHASTAAAAAAAYGLAKLHLRRYRALPTAPNLLAERAISDNSRLPISAVLGNILHDARLRGTNNGFLEKLDSATGEEGGG